MAEYYGRLQGNRGEATRMGTKASGIWVTAETWKSRVVTEMKGSPHTKSGHISMISLCPKNGFSVARLDLNTDGIMETADDPAVKEALKILEDACVTVNTTVRAVQKWESEFELRIRDLSYEKAANLVAILQQEPSYEVMIIDVTPCESKVWHGPGHQSSTTCENTGIHSEHGALIMNQWVEWEDSDADPDGSIYID